MCGIAGLIGREAREPELTAALAAIAHRGPDGTGVFRAEGACLLHTRLSVIDLSDRARQPMTDSASGVTIILNGEIYNYKELRKGLDQSAFFSDSDTEVLLRLYLRDGIDAVSELRGMFAFAIWDPRTRTTHLARDRLGIKPLFYARDDGAVAFGSEIKAVAAFSARPKLNLPMVLDYLEDGRVAHTSETFFQGVEALPPGSVATVSGEGFSIAKYWMMPAASQSPERDADADTIEREGWRLLNEVTALHMISDVPIGVSLSAGFDSQFVARLLSHVGCPEIDAFTWGFEDATYDESRLIAKNSFGLNFRHHPVIIRAEDVIPSLLEASPFFEIPLGGVGTIGQFRVMQTAREQGVPVVLSGHGSDEIFGGYHYYYMCRFHDLWDRGRLAELDTELAAFAHIFGQTLKAGSPEFTRVVLNRGNGRLAPDGSAMSGNAHLGRRLSELVRPMPSVVPGAAAQGGHLRRRMIGDLKAEKASKQLWYDDRSSMAFGIETRVPFFDHRLVEWAFSLPESFFIRDGVNKFLPKQLMKRFCGIEFPQPQKHYVSNPQREWLKGPLFDSVCSFVKGGTLDENKIIDMPRFIDSYRTYTQAPELGNSFFVWKVVALEAFVRTCFGGRA